ncbi:hypothetical protein [Desulfocastanea catecholica]
MHERGYSTIEIIRRKEPPHGTIEATLAIVAGRRIVYVFISGV